MFSNNFICMCFCAKKIAVWLLEALLRKPVTSLSHRCLLLVSSSLLNYDVCSLDTDWPEWTRILEFVLHFGVKHFLRNGRARSTE